MSTPTLNGPGARTRALTSVAPPPPPPPLAPFRPGKRGAPQEAPPAYDGSSRDDLWRQSELHRTRQVGAQGIA